MRRDGVLAVQAPVLLIVQLVTWLVIFALGYTLLLLPSVDTLQHALREAVSSLFTLGFDPTRGFWADRARRSRRCQSGLIVVAIQIAYLPTLYAAFNRRETEVTLLQARAGSPPWGPELLARTRYGILGADDLPEFYSCGSGGRPTRGEPSNYPVLIRFRSPQPFTSWLVALVAVSTGGALSRLASEPRTPRNADVPADGVHRAAPDRRRHRRAGRHGPRPDEPLQLTYDDYLIGVQRLMAEGFPVERTPEEAWPHFRGWRVNYESIGYAVARKTDAVPARWAGPRRGGEEPIDTQRPPNRTPEAPGDPDAGRLIDGLRPNT